jgi:hypothetical protein
VGLLHLQVASEYPPPSLSPVIIRRGKPLNKTFTDLLRCFTLQHNGGNLQRYTKSVKHFVKEPLQFLNNRTRLYESKFRQHAHNPGLFKPSNPYHPPPPTLSSFPSLFWGLFFLIFGWILFFCLSDFDFLPYHQGYTGNDNTLDVSVHPVSVHAKRSF